MFKKLSTLASAWLMSEEGSTAAEYAILVALIAIAVVGGAAILGPAISRTLCAAASHMP